MKSSKHHLAQNDHLRMNLFRRGRICNRGRRAAGDGDTSARSSPEKAVARCVNNPPMRVLDFLFMELLLFACENDG